VKFTNAGMYINGTGNALMSYDKYTGEIDFYSEAHVEANNVYSFVAAQKKEWAAEMKKKLAASTINEAEKAQLTMELKRVAMPFTIGDLAMKPGKYDKEIGIPHELVHETGHAVYFQLLTTRDKAAVDDEFLADAGDEISTYAKSSAYEFFAECYALYRSNLPEEKKAALPLKIRMMLDKYVKGV